MPSDTPHEKMREHDRISDEIHEREKAKHRLIKEIGDELTATVEDAVHATSVRAEVTDVNDTGETYTIRPRLDYPTLVKRLTQRLPPSFDVESFNSDGSVDLIWNETPDAEREPDRMAVIKAIIRSNTIESEIMVESSPTVDQVVSEAVELGFSDAESRDDLETLARLGMVKINDDESVYIQW